MNKRSFLKSLLTCAVAPSILLPTFKDAHKWKRTENFLFMPNPAWQDAPYEVAFLFPYQRIILDIPSLDENSVIPNLVVDRVIFPYNMGNIFRQVLDV